MGAGAVAPRARDDSAERRVAAGHLGHARLGVSRHRARPGGLRSAREPLGRQGPDSHRRTAARVGRPSRPVIWGTPGWESRDTAHAQAAYDQLANLSAAKARTRIVELLRESGDLVG